MFLSVFYDVSMSSLLPFLCIPLSFLMFLSVFVVLDVSLSSYVFLDVCLLWHFTILLVIISLTMFLSVFVLYDVSLSSFVFLDVSLCLCPLWCFSVLLVSVCLQSFFDITLSFWSFVRWLTDPRMVELDILYLNSSWASQWQCSMIPGSFIFSSLLLYLSSLFRRVDTHCCTNWVREESQVIVEL